eukprot:CAMPEP_0168334978 /NCGR_PEP_ID=MMETSP0213-20121227/10621_1 /TAXON_ID=151035 /ORGANISM="Euplotes harpa, Strain FSP1.4" /LENGTH=111 /DNA_ID=CAMNT_0008339789 /DNA_START=78 /DNA_END=414 /DNA_ORIENTATION=+
MKEVVRLRDVPRRERRPRYSQAARNDIRMKEMQEGLQKDMEVYEEADEYCPGCDNHYVIEAITPEDKGRLVIGFEAKKGYEHMLNKDEREKERGPTLMDYADLELSDTSDP